MLCTILELADKNLHNGVNQIIVSSSVLCRSCETFSTKKLYFPYFQVVILKKLSDAYVQIVLMFCIVQIVMDTKCEVNLSEKVIISCKVMKYPGTWQCRHVC